MSLSPKTMFKIDTSELAIVQNALNRLPHKVFRTDVAQKALLIAATPMLNVMKINTPVGKKVYLPKSKSGDITYARGGYLKIAIRKKITNYPKFGEVRVLVGYSKLPGKAGWRAHFTEHGYTSPSGRKIPGQKFMKRSELATIKFVEDIFNREIAKEVDNYTNKL